MSWANLFLHLRKARGAEKIILSQSVSSIYLPEPCLTREQRTYLPITASQILSQKHATILIAQSKPIRKAVIAEGFWASAEVNGFIWRAEMPELCYQSWGKPALLCCAGLSSNSGIHTSTTVFQGASSLSGNLSRKTPLNLNFMLIVKVMQIN